MKACATSPLAVSANEMMTGPLAHVLTHVAPNDSAQDATQESQAAEKSTPSPKSQDPGAGRPGGPETRSPSDEEKRTTASAMLLDDLIASGADADADDVDAALDRIDDIISVLTSMSRLRGAGSPTAWEQRLISRAYAYVTSLVARTRPRSLTSPKAVRKTMEDLGYRPRPWKKTKMQEEEENEIKSEPLAFANTDATGVLQSQQPKDQMQDFQIQSQAQPIKPQHSYPQLTSQIQQIQFQQQQQQRQSPHLQLPNPSQQLQVKQNQSPHRPLPNQIQFQTPVQDQAYPSVVHQQKPSEKDQSKIVQVSETQPPISAQTTLEASKMMNALHFHHLSHRRVSDKAALQQTLQNLMRSLQSPSIVQKGVPGNSILMPHQLEYPLTCEICRITEAGSAKWLVCDGCESGFHVNCLALPWKGSQPPLVDWYCSKCNVDGKSRASKYGPVKLKSPATDPSSVAVSSLPSAPKPVVSQPAKPGDAAPKPSINQTASVKPNPPSSIPVPAVPTPAATPMTTAGEEHTQPVLLKESQPLQSDTFGSASDYKDKNLINGMTNVGIEGRNIIRSMSETQNLEVQKINDNPTNQRDTTNKLNQNQTIGLQVDEKKNEAERKSREEEKKKSKNDRREKEGETNSKTTISTLPPPNPVGVKGIFEWIGLPVKREGHKIYYSAFLFDSVIYKMNDHALFRPEAQGSPPYVARLELLWEDGNNHTKWTKVNWCYFPIDIPDIKPPQPPLEKEVYESNHSDNNPIEAIQGPCLVLPPLTYQDEMKKRKALSSENGKSSITDPPLFLGRFFYDASQGTFKAMSAG